MNRPNVLVITCHDLGDYLGCYRTPVRTPNADALASSGVRFTNHFSAGTVCSPSRGAILTGCYPHTNGLMGLVHLGWELDAGACTPMPALLRQAGYETHLIGYQHEHWDPGELGYEHVHLGSSKYGDDVAPVAEEWVRSRGGQQRPFFAALGWFETHRIHGYWRWPTYAPADPSAVRVRPYLADIAGTRGDLAEFYGAIGRMDALLGRVLETLDRAGLAENTLVIFTSDHGASLMHSKGTLYDGGTKVALLLRWPGGLPQGVRYEGLTSHVDILPTVLELLGLRVPGHVQGRSFAAAARAQTPSQPRELVFAERNYVDCYDPARMVRLPRYKYIRNGLRKCIFDFVVREIAFAPSGFRGHPEVFDFYSAHRCQEELYDLSTDPGELRNLAEDSGARAALDRMRALLAAHLEATDDPFRHLRNDMLMPVDSLANVRRSKTIQRQVSS